MEGPQAGTEAEALDADLKTRAAAAEKVLEYRFEAEGALNVAFDFGDFAVRKFFPAWADRSVVAKAAEEELDFGESETHFSGEADEQDAIESVGRVAALAADAVRRGEQAAFFVVANGRGVKAGASGEFSDFHSFSYRWKGYSVFCSARQEALAARAGQAPSLPDTGPGFGPEIPLDLKLTLTFSIREWDVANPIWRKP